MIKHYVIHCIQISTNVNDSYSIHKMRLPLHPDKKSCENIKSRKLESWSNPFHFYFNCLPLSPSHANSCVGSRIKQTQSPKRPKYASKHQFVCKVALSGYADEWWFWWRHNTSIKPSPVMLITYSANCSKASENVTSDNSRLQHVPATKQEYLLSPHEHSTCFFLDNRYLPFKNSKLYMTPM